MPTTAVNPIDRHIGQRLQVRRQFLRMSAAEAAARLGVSEQVFSELESGALRVDPVLLFRLTGLLGVKLRYFYAGLQSAGETIRARAG